MPAKKKLTKKKPAAKAAQPSSKKRPMPTKAKPAAKKAAPKSKAKPMAKKKKPAAKKPARRPFHEGGMIDMELDMLEAMAGEAMMAARNSNNPEALDRIFRDFTMGIDQVREINQRGMDAPRPNPNVPQPQITPEQQQAARRMNQAQFMRPQFPQTTMERPMRPEPPKRTPIRPMPTQPNIPRPILITPEEQARRDALENNRNPQRTGPRYVDTATGGSRPSNFTPGPRRPQRIGSPAMYPDGSRPPSRPVPTPTPMGPRAGGTINPNPTRVPLNQPPMDRRPRRLTPDPVTFDAGGNRVIPDFAKPSMDRIKQQQAMRAMNQARFTGPQITPQMQAAARQRQQGTTPRPMNRGGMVARPKMPIHPDMPTSFGQGQPNKPTGRR